MVQPNEWQRRQYLKERMMHDRRAHMKKANAETKDVRMSALKERIASGKKKVTE